MSGQSRKFLQGIVSRISKSPMLYNASNAIGNASSKAQSQLTNMQNIAAEKYDTIVKQVNGTIVIQDMQSAPLQQSAPIPDSLINWWRWYRKFTGLEDVEAAQQHVIAVQNKLFKSQDERRVLTNQAAVTAEKLKEIYGELVQTRRDDPKYVQLTILENKALQEQSRIGSQLKLLENAERDHFTQLATAIKEYHDSQAINAQKYKYLSILASAVFAIVSLCGSMVYNNRRIRDMRISIAEAQRQNEAMFKTHFNSLEQMLLSMKVSNNNVNPSIHNVVLEPQNIVGDPKTPNLNVEHQNIEPIHNPTDYPSILTTSSICIGIALLILSRFMS